MFSYTHTGSSLSSAQRPFSRGLLALLLGLLLLLPAVALTAAAPRTALAQTKSFHMDHYDSDIVVNPDGSLDVNEKLVYVYDQGSFHRGTRNIPLDKVSGITGVRVLEEVNGQLVEYRQASYDPDSSTSGVPGTFGTLNDGSQLWIRWVYDYTANASRTFHVIYHAAGAVRVYSTYDQLNWYAVPPQWASAINASRVSVTLPGGVDAGKLTVDSVPPAEAAKQGSTIIWSTTSGLDQCFRVGIQDIPKNVMQAAPPPWQQAVDAREKSQPLIDLAVLLLGLLVLIGGILWSVMRWYSHGRDKPVKLLSDYITDPPSTLPPGLVGTLLDESADVRDVIATVVDLGRKGDLTIQETQTGGIGGLFQSKDFQYAQTGTKVDYRFEEMVLHSIFKHGNPVSLSELKNTFYSDLPPIYDEMYNSLVALKYFPENPKSVRNRNRAGGVFFLLLAFGLNFSAGELSPFISWFLWLLPVAFGATGLVWLLTAGAMPRKTDFGSEEAEKWRAFGRYLQQMQRYTNVQAAADKFQQFLPYAVAMGIERQLISQFNQVPSAMPRWYAPYGYGPIFYPYPVGSPAGGQQGMASGPGGGVPQMNPADAMQGLSTSLAGAMQGMSDSFTTMVNSASNVLTSQPSSSGSGGGWGGGGGGFSGGGGGGGGGGGAD
jgi:uncharacterized membrane protein YgcG